MGLLKRTYALPDEILDRFERKVKAGKRSAVLGDVLRDWLDNQERERIRHEVIEGCREMADEYLSIEKEFHSLEEEAGRAVKIDNPKRRYRRRTTRSR